MEQRSTKGPHSGRKHTHVCARRIDSFEPSISFFFDRVRRVKRIKKELGVGDRREGCALEAVIQIE